MIPINGNPLPATTFDNVGSTTQTSGIQSKPVDSPEEQKLKKAAGEFESILLASMWKSMKQSFATDDDSGDPAHGTLEDWGIEIMSGAVGKAGALGIGKMILQRLEPVLEQQGSASSGSTEASTGTAPQGTKSLP